jgi:hypothetical protein
MLLAVGGDLIWICIVEWVQNSPHRQAPRLGSSMAVVQSHARAARLEVAPKQYQCRASARRNTGAARASRRGRRKGHNTVPNDPAAALY